MNDVKLMGGGITSKQLPCWNGYVVIACVLLCLLGLCSYCFLSGFSLASIILIAVALPFSLSLPSGFFVNGPNEAQVVEFFGEYVGTALSSGLLFTVPFCTRTSISLKIETTNTPVIKVNDADGNPVEIAAVIIWRVTCPAKACLNISDYQGFMSVQGETAVRELAGGYPYDSCADVSLRHNSTEISQKLRGILQDRAGEVGIWVEDAKISHLAYSSEIAQVMLRRQQARAISEARAYIVKNAVNMVDEVLAHLESKHSIVFTDDQKLRFVSNLLVALVSENEAQPVISLD